MSSIEVVVPAPAARSSPGPFPVYPSSPRSASSARNSVSSPVYPSSPRSLSSVRDSVSSPVCPSSPQSPSVYVGNNLLDELIDMRAWPDVLERLRSHPKEAGDNIRRGFQDESLPLHEACKLQPPAEVVTALISVNPNAARTPGAYSNLPLHSAARSDSVEAVEVLIKEYPGAARRRDESGKLPLHLACKWGASPFVVDLLLRLYPEGQFVRDDDGKNPMEYSNALNDNVTPHKSEIVEVMSRGGAYCSVSKSAYGRVKEELDSQARALGKAHAVELTNLERKHADEITLSRRLEDGLRESLKHAGKQAKKNQALIHDLKTEKEALETELLVSKKAEDVLKTHADMLESTLNEKEEKLQTALKNEEAMKTRMKETAVMAACFESMQAELEGKTLALERKELELLKSHGRVAALSRHLVDAARRDDRNMKKIGELSRSVLSLSASVSAFTVSNESLIQRAIEEQEKAMKMVLTSDGGEIVQKQVLRQQERVVHETDSLERILKSAEAKKEGSFWEEIGEVNIGSEDDPVNASEVAARESGNRNAGADSIGGHENTEITKGNAS